MGLGGFVFREEGFDEFFGVEGFDVVGGFADADEFDGDVELVADGDDDAAFGGAVEFGEEDTSDVDGFEEFLGLADGVLAGRRVEHQQHFVWGIGDALFDDAADFGELAHQVVLRVQAAGGVDDEHVDVAIDGGVTRIKGNGGGVGSHLVLHDLHINPLRPDGELLDGGGAEGVAGGDHDGLALGFEVAAELGDGGGFAGTVDAGDEDDGGAGGGELKLAGFDGPVGFHFGFEKLEDFIAGGNFSVFPRGIEVGHDFGSGFDAEVGGDEALLEFVEELSDQACGHGGGSGGRRQKHRAFWRGQI